MAIKRTAAATQAPQTQSVQTSPDVVNVNEPTLTPTTGSVAVPETSADSATTNPTSPRRGRPAGYKGGPRLTWGQVVNGDAKLLQKTLVEVARDVSTKFNGRATLLDVVEGLKAHPVFTDNKSVDGVPLSDLVSVTNVRNKWAELKNNYSIGWAMKPVEEGGLGLTGDVDKVAEELTDEQWNQMEDRIARPKPEGLNFPKLVILRGRKGQTLGMEDI